MQVVTWLPNYANHFRLGFHPFDALQMFQLFTYFIIDAPYEDGSDDPKDYKFVKWITKDKVSYDILLPINQQLLRKYI